MADRVEVFSDGACRGNPGPGGWGALLRFKDNEKTIKGGEENTTNNRMELNAAIEGILLLPAGSSVQIFTASDYVFQGITKWIIGWRKRNWVKKDDKPVANADLWQALDALTDQYSVKWVNAKGQALKGLEEASKIASETLKLI